MKNWLYASVAAGAATVLSATAFAGSAQRAVSGPNASIDARAGAMNGDGAIITSGTASAPIGNRYGVQVDALYGRNAGSESAGVGGHFFYRDPSTMLLGVTAMTAHTDNTDFNRFGVEGEWYASDYTIAPELGYQTGDNKLDDSIYYTLDGSYYQTQNLKYTLGTTGFEGNQALYGKAEWQPYSNQPLSVFADIGAANRGNAFAFVGVRYSFGAEGTSIQKRDRTGDPRNIVTQSIDYLGSAIEGAGQRLITNGGGGGNNG